MQLDSFLKFFTVSTVLQLCKHVVYGEVVELNMGNADSVLRGSDLAIVNFYADWCRFSKILAPTFEEAGKKVKEEIPVPGSVVFAKVDCDQEGTLAARYRINKYPTLKIFRGGVMMKKEYRGQRSVEALTQFAKEQSKPSVDEVESMDKLEDLDTKKLNIIGFFDNKMSDNYRQFSRVASILQDDCKFYAAVGPVSAEERQNGDHVNFRPSDYATSHQDMLFPGALNDFDALHAWIQERCTPLVREITFENAEELTEEGLPFVILFSHPDDKTSPDVFRQRVAEEVASEKSSVNFLVADGIKFAHPLHHLGKSARDLPILAIDSFRHMYLFPHPVVEGLRTDGLLKKFIDDLHSGKLHREFHHGPDPTTAPPKVIAGSDDTGDSNTDNVPRDEVKTPPAPQKITSPPESTFKKLGPSRNRYTILRDEL